MFFNLFAEEKERGIHIRHARQISRIYCGFQSEGQLLVVYDESVMVGAEKFRHHLNIRFVGGRLKLAGFEILLVIRICDGKSI